ncbi:ATP-binding cassette domain-containing protein [Bacteriovoracaceae bacterium]|nr:ATP-binding cassette domain-containing protein [Bacteriovoracaceae bacterium]
MLQVNQLHKDFGSRILLEGVTFNMSKSEKMGLVGRNGHGKSTLLKIIAGIENSSSGTVSFPKGYRLGYLSQHLSFSKETVLTECLEVLDGDENQAYKVYSFLDGLGFQPEDYEKNPMSFSGGMQLRIHLAKTLLSDSDILLLDEPTNYLDLSSMIWLGQYLKSLKSEIIIISHNKQFMNSVCDSIGGIYLRKFKKVKGDTYKYYEQLQIEQEVQEKAKVNQDKKIKHMQSFVDKYRAKARGASQAQSRLKSLQKMEDLSLEEDQGLINFRFHYAAFSAKILCEIKDLAFAYPEKELLFKNLNIPIRANDRIGIVGLNGKGKSTLLKLLSKKLQPSTGELRFHNKCIDGFFGQTNIDLLNPTITVQDEIASANPELETSLVRSICGSLLFSGDDALKKVSVLSGGEKSRVLLGKILAQKCNMLLLDEPNNHLDMESIEILIEELNSFPGAVVIVCHDMDILQRVCKKFIVFHEDNAFEFLGGFDDYYNKFLKNNSTGEVSTVIKNTSNSKNQNKRIMSKEFKTTLRKLERDIQKTEELIYKIESEIEDKEKLLSELDSSNQEEINRGSQEWQELKNQLEKNFSKLEKYYEEKEQLEKENI